MDRAIEADEGVDAQSIADSGYDDSVYSSDSLRSSVFAYEKENGRTYHAFHAGKYHVPNDEGEQERMDIHYHALRLSIGDKLFHAPIESPTGILDVGAGTGIWAMDAADSFPAAEVIGFDLSPIQPTSVPPNLSFEVLDLDETWGYGRGRFDLVHTRFMNGFSIRNWDHVYEEAFKTLKPGGWIENQEFDCVVLSDDNTIPADSSVQKWVTLWNQGMAMFGMTGRCDPEVLAEKMRNAGFVNVHIKNFKMPIGPWPKNRMLKEAGVYGLVAICDGMDGLSIRVFTKALGWSMDELQVFLAQVRAEFKRRSIHSYWPSFIIMGQKPAEKSNEPESEPPVVLSDPDLPQDDVTHRAESQPEQRTTHHTNVEGTVHPQVAPSTVTSEPTERPISDPSDPASQPRDGENISRIH